MVARRTRTARRAWKAGASGSIADQMLTMIMERLKTFQPERRYFQNRSAPHPIIISSAKRHVYMSSMTSNARRSLLPSWGRSCASRTAERKETRISPEKKLRYRSELYRRSHRCRYRPHPVMLWAKLRALSARRSCAAFLISDTHCRHSPTLYACKTSLRPL